MAVNQRERFTGCKTVTVPQGYVGETKGNLRDGYGVYTYPNSFFRYEGEWSKGVKQGFGRFKMRDGSYYEGQFTDGEITGEGRRYWPHTNSIYEGTFDQGELCGRGQMTYGNGSLYEGQWMDNKREGEGVLQDICGNVYKGSFYQNKRHGDGVQTYKNGNKYDGGWINDLQHGHGLMSFADKSIYEGQWRCGLMNGEGSLVHSSDMTYNGLWVNGRPLMEPVKIEVVGGDVICFEQAEVLFTINVQCITQDNEITIENGRVLRVSAGIRLPTENVVLPSTSKLSSTSNNSTPSLDVYTDRRTTPFGFDIEAYPLTTLYIGSEQEKRAETAFEDIQEASCESIAVANPVATTTVENPPSTMVNQPNAVPNSLNEESNPLITTDTSYYNDGATSPSNDDGLKSRSKSHSNLPPSSLDVEVLTDVPITKCTAAGTCTFMNLTLPCLPTVSNQSSTCLSPESTESKTISRNRKNTEASSTKLSDTREKKKLADDVTKTADRENSGRKKKNTKAKGEVKAEEANLEKFCKAGDYVIIIEDVSERPFLDIILPPAYVHVKVSPFTKRSRSRSTR